MTESITAVMADVIAYIRAHPDEHIHIGPRFCSRCLDVRDLPKQRLCAECRRQDRLDRKCAKTLKEIAQSFTCDVFLDGMIVLD